MLTTMTTLLHRTNQLGTFIVCHDDMAARHLDELLHKHHALQEETAFADTYLLADDAFGVGLFAMRLAKCRRLLSRFYTTTNDAFRAQKEYAFALRSLLQYTAYKPLIKELERTNSPNRAQDTFLQFIEGTLPTEHAQRLVAKQRLLDVWQFTCHLREIGRFTARLDGTKQMTADDLQHFDTYAQQALPTLRTFEQAARTIAPHIETMTKYFCTFIHTAEPYANWDEAQWLTLYGDNTFPLAALWPSENALSDMNRFQLPVASIMATTFVTFDDCLTLVNELLQQTTPETLLQAPQSLEANWQQLVTQFALSRYIAHTTDALPLTEKIDGKQELKKAQKPAKAPVLAASKKELTAANERLQRAEQQAAYLEAELKKREQTLREQQQYIAELQQEQEALQALCEQLEETPTIQQQTYSLMTEMETMMQQLKATLPKQVVNTSSIFDDIEPLKIAVIGGHQRYHSQLKEKFKQPILTLTPDKLQFNLPQLLNYDVVVFTTQYANHSLYERAYDYMKKMNYKSHALIISTQPNARRLAMQIADFYSDII